MESRLQLHSVVLLGLLATFLVTTHGQVGTCAGDGAGLNGEEMWPVEVGMEYRVWRRKLLTPLELCLECKCCSSTTCATMPCCFGINCQLPNKPFGVCAFVPKSCHCTSCST
ncbi:hypothetical protein CARUB_v10012729mg [Capsella rubella]|uniref:DUF7866 domain-containing protein n=1 Tax=Capsella rubella TaxID=81985 RepID=R0ET57_9BRAS|nr:hypothetical protein CARUB_v10012729mg [Capsella rubella]